MWDILNSQGTSGGSTERLVEQQVQGSTVQQLQVDEPLFALALPADWKEIERRHSSNEHSITWQATQKGEDNRWLKLYIDTIPTKQGVNRLLPVKVSTDHRLTFGQLSDNCMNFTGPGLEALHHHNPGPIEAQWQQTKFICDLTHFVENKVGTSSSAGINTISIESPTKGQHRYFFLYTDHNVQPKYSILYNALTSFQAK